MGIILIFCCSLFLVPVFSSIDFKKNNQMGYFAVEKKQSPLSLSIGVTAKKSFNIRCFVHGLAKTGRDLPISSLYFFSGVLISTTFSIISLFNRFAAVSFLKAVSGTAAASVVSVTVLILIFQLPFVRDFSYFEMSKCLFGVYPVVADSKMNALVQMVAKNSGLKDPIKKVYVVNTNEKNANCVSIGSFSAVTITQVSFLLQTLLL